MYDDKFIDLENNYLNNLNGDMGFTAKPGFGAKNLFWLRLSPVMLMR